MIHVNNSKFDFLEMQAKKYDLIMKAIFPLDPN
jgi:hypothetical protein